MTTIEVDDPQRAGATPGRTDGAPVMACFARQPILNRDGMLCGFELKLHCVDEPTADEGAAASARVEQTAHPTANLVDADTAAGEAQPSAAVQPTFTQTVVAALMDSGMCGALNDHPGYVDVSREMLFDDALEVVPAERFMFEIQPDIEVDDALIARIVVLHARRYRFVLDAVVVPNDTFARLLPYAEGVKIDFPRISRALLPKLSTVLKSAGKLLIAAGIDAQEDFETALNLGFDRFQGYFFARAHTASLRRVSAPRHALLNLLQLLAGDPTVAQLEAELKLNPVLVMHLMKLANSSGLAVGHKVTTLREAINATGTNRIARWTQLLLYADGRKVALEDDPLLQLAATRARFMELAVLRLPRRGRRGVSDRRVLVRRCGVRRFARKHLERADFVKADSDGDLTSRRRAGLTVIRRGCAGARCMDGDRSRVRAACAVDGERSRGARVGRGGVGRRCRSQRRGERLGAYRGLIRRIDPDEPVRGPRPGFGARRQPGGKPDCLPLHSISISRIGAWEKKRPNSRASSFRAAISPCEIRRGSSAWLQSPYSSATVD
jgi:c-di-GMP-related signal transduction protein